MDLAHSEETGVIKILDKFLLCPRSFCNGHPGLQLDSQNRFTLGRAIVQQGIVHFVTSQSFWSIFLENRSSVSLYTKQASLADKHECLFCILFTIEPETMVKGR